jgi:hypothetical protein
MKHRVIYAILWLLTVIAYSIPWATADGQTFVGWNFTVPFSITYVIGILLGLIALIVRYKPVLLTIIAGILMILGVVGALLSMAVLSGFTATKLHIEAGVGFAFILSIVYMVTGAYCSKRMVVKKA